MLDPYAKPSDSAAEDLMRAIALTHVLALTGSNLLALALSV
jgi:hypothetical protein